MRPIPSWDWCVLHFVFGLVRRLSLINSTPLRTNTYTDCSLTIVRARVVKSKDNDEEFLLLKLRVGQMISVLDQGIEAMKKTGGSLELGELELCLNEVNSIASTSLEKGGLVKFASAGSFRKRVKRASKALDNHLAAVTLHALTSIVADSATLKEGQSQLINHLETLNVLVRGHMLAQDKEIEKELTTKPNDDTPYFPGQNTPSMVPTALPPSRVIKRQLTAWSVTDPISSSNDAIHFGETHDKYFPFSFCSTHPIFYDGNAYPTAAHLFACFQFFTTAPHVIPTLLSTVSPKEVRLTARKLRSLRRPDWFDVHLGVMDQVQMAKFEQHPKLTALLLSTYNSPLEFDHDDDFWGNRFSRDHLAKLSEARKTKNQLGKSLMRVRTMLVDSPVYFNSLSTSHRAFSPESLHPVVWNSTTHISCQHLFQSLKFFSTAPHIVDLIGEAITANAAKEIGEHYTHLQRKDWDNIQLSMMEIALKCKFDQYPALKEELLVTGSRRLLYLHPEEPFWGTGAEGKSGRNEVGKALMRIRSQYREVPHQDLD
ncbi:hypothetical protein T439DRAFT_320447 [Meredithblackwellia eburnea MCA 4105]